MPPSSGNTELARSIQDLQQLIVKVEAHQSAMEDNFERMQQHTDTQNRDLKMEYVTKTEFQLQMENLRLTITLLRTTVEQLEQRMKDTETTIVNEVKDIALQQQQAQRASQRRTIIVQAAVLTTILAAIVPLVLKVLFHL